MAWIESHQALGNHPKTMRLAVNLKVSLPTAVGLVHYLWWWALDYAPDGGIGRFEPIVIAQACRWPKNPVAFLAALVDAGFVDTAGDIAEIHDWSEYAGGLLDRRARDAERKRTSRGKPAEVRVESNGTTNGHPPTVARTSALARGGRTQPDQPTNQQTGQTGPDTTGARPGQVVLGPGEIVGDGGYIYSAPNQDGDRSPTGRHA